MGCDLGEVDGNVLVLELGDVLGCELGEVDCNVFTNVIGILELGDANIVVLGCELGEADCDALG